jgi:serine/threonine protein phosphatase PrpC
LDTVEVQKDDIIILSSDGLWDVIQDDQLQEIVERNANKVIYFSVLFIRYQLFFL